MGYIRDALTCVQTDIYLFKAEFPNVITHGVYRKILSNFESINSAEAKDTS